MTNGVVRAVVFAAVCGLTGASASASDLRHGEAIFKSKCATCHSVVAGKHTVGPSLHGIVGRKAGTAEGFTRYVGLKGARWHWDDQTLDKFLANPPGITMNENRAQSPMLTKLPAVEDRRRVMKYLDTLK